MYVHTFKVSHIWIQDNFTDAMHISLYVTALYNKSI